jgi:thioesterase domain-containing protein/non-ribosomal peptide synthetase component F
MLPLNDPSYLCLPIDHFSGGAFLFAGPTTEAQREMWATIQMSQESTLCYNEVLELNLSGNLNLKALNKSLSVMLQNHDALNSLFSDDGKTFFIQEAPSVDLAVLDLVSSQDQSEDIAALKQKEVLTPFDLRNGRCIRFTLIRKDFQNHLLLIAAHHIVCDGWSFAVLLSELGQTYSSLLGNTSTPSPSLNQFADYAIEELQDGQNESHKKYWLDQFRRSLDVETFPTDFARPAFRSYESDFLRIDIPDDLVQSVKRLGISQGSSLYNVLMANFMILMKRISSSNDTVVGVASAAQSSTGKLDLVGHLVSLLPLRVSINEDFAFTQFLRSLRGSMLDAFDHQSISFGTLLKELNLARKASEIPLLNCVFNIDQQSHGQGLNFTDIEASYVVVPRRFENFELFVNAVSCGKTLSIECQYNSVLFQRSTVQNWLECYVELLKICTINPSVTLKDITLPDLTIPKPLEDQASLNEIIVVRCLETEKKLIKIWGNVLSLSQVLPEDNFFMLGGHSLLAVELANLLQTEFQKKISIKDIFERPTVIDLASYIAESSTQITLTNIEVRPEIIEAPVSHNQMQTWYVEELFPETRMHNLSTSLRIKWDLDPKVMEKSIQYFIKRHEALRTAIFLKDDLPWQRILNVNHPAFQTALELIQTNEKEVFQLMRAETALAFDKSQAPMFKAKLYQLGVSDYILFMSVHHAVWDGWCFDIFFEELDVIYSALDSGTTPVFKRNPEIRYLDHSLWMQQSIDNGAFGPQLKYWKNQLKAPLPILEIPTDFKRPVMPSHDGGNFRFALKNEQIELIKSFAASRNVSVFNVMLTAFKMTMAHFTGMNDIIVGSPVRGRNSPELLQTIGYFVNTLALRSQIDLDQDFEANLKRVTETCLEAFSHQDYPFELLLREVDYKRDFGRTAIFQTFFTFQDMTNRQFYINEKPVQQVSVNNASVKTDLDIWVKVTTTGIEGAIEYRSDLFKSSTIESFYQCFDLVLRNISLGTSFKNALPCLSHSSVPTTYAEQTQSMASDSVETIPFSFDEMRHIWMETLGISSIERGDSFFDLGGNSLLAVKLFSSLEKKYHIELRLSDLIHESSLESFSRFFDSKITISAVLDIPTLTLSLIPLRKNGIQKPIFFFHGVGGNILNYVPLTRHIDPDYPVYALQSQGIDGSAPLKTSIEEMASAYIREMRTVSPHGPFILVGGSMGGLIAFEVAQQLISQGDQIERLVLLDTFGPDVNIQKYDKNERSFLKNVSISLRYRAQTIVTRIQKFLYQGLGLQVPLEIRLFEAEVSNYKALWKYRPKKYSGNIALIRAKMKSSGWYSDPHMGWSKTILGQINMTEIEGEHHSFIESPQLGNALAQQLQ